jgi:hypothetical protein
MKSRASRCPLRVSYGNVFTAAGGSLAKSISKCRASEAGGSSVVGFFRPWEGRLLAFGAEECAGNPRHDHTCSGKMSGPLTGVGKPKAATSRRTPKFGVLGLVPALGFFWDAVWFGD